MAKGHNQPLFLRDFTVEVAVDRIAIALDFGLPVSFDLLLDCRIKPASQFRAVTQVEQDFHPHEERSQDESLH